MGSSFLCHQSGIAKAASEWNRPRYIYLEKDRLPSVKDIGNLLSGAIMYYAIFLYLSLYHTLQHDQIYCLQQLLLPAKTLHGLCWQVVRFLNEDRTGLLKMNFKKLQPFWGRKETLSRGNTRTNGNCHLFISSYRTAILKTCPMKSALMKVTTGWVC